MRFTGLTGGLAVLALLAAGCGDDGGGDGEEATATDEACEPGEEVDPDLDEVRAVPEEYETVQAAVDATVPCDLVLVSPGVYNEAVTVKTDDVVIRGLDRNEVILDGEFELANGIRVLASEGVAVENMTARNYTTNGFFWTDGSHRYRGSYLTAHNNGDYGIYAFDSRTGLFESSYGSGSPDAGFYIGQCYPCDAVLDDVVAENNGLGYSGTNSGGDLYIVGSTFRHNRAGIVPNSGTYEEEWPERETTIVGNVVHDNTNYETAAIDSARRAGGNGIVVAGGNDNVIERNLVYGHDVAGIAVVPIDDEGVEGGIFWPEGNQVTTNVVEGSELADLAVFDEGEGANCYGGNTFGSSAPRAIEDLYPCEGEGSGAEPRDPLDINALSTLEGKPESGDYRDQPVPEPRENMPDAATAPWEPAGEPPEVDLEAIEVPDRPE